jgi:PAS domain S-box-containing protein
MAPLLGPSDEARTRTVTAERQGDGALGATLSEERIGFFADALRWVPADNTQAQRPAVSEWAIGDRVRVHPAVDEPGSRLRVLLANEQNEARGRLARVLSQRYEVIEVADLTAALQATQQAMPDLVLADAGTAPGHGINLVRELRASAATQAIPVMLLATDASDAARIEAFEAGADDFLTRPFSTRGLTARMAAHMALYQLRREVAERQAQQQRSDEIARANDALMSEIAERKRIETALGFSEQRARMIVDMALDAVVTIDASGGITSWNRQAEQVFGWAATEAIGRLISEVIIPADQRSAHLRGLQHFLKTGDGPILNRRIETMALHRDGHIFPVELTVAPIQLQQGWTFSAFIRDLTEQKAKEAMLREAQAELARVSRITTTGELAAWMAHEVNQPLSAIVSNGQTCLHWLSEATLNLGKARAAGERIVRDARLAADVVSRIRAIATKSQPVQAQVDINSVIHDVLELLDNSLRRNAILVESELAADIPSVVGDRVQLQQVLLNLLVNAIEAMSSVTDRQRTARILSRRKGTDGVLVAIQDAGNGIEAQALDQMFEPFFTTKQGGMGMGLSICRSIIEAHGGRLWVTQGQPTGAVFQFLLPIEAD